LLAHRFENRGVLSMILDLGLLRLVQAIGF
jgi:hypothetical protein